MSSLKKTKIKFAGRPRTRKVMDADGVVIEEKACPLLHMKMVDPAGNVVKVPVANGGSMNSLNENPYAAIVTQEKVKAGFLNYFVCPKGLCETKGPAVIRPEAFNDVECCDHMESVIKARRNKHNELQAQTEKVFNARDERWVKMAVEAARQASQPSVSQSPADRKPRIKVQSDE